MITLIGTSHFDLDGYTRLTKLLRKIKPSIVGVEDTKEGFEESLKVVRLLSNPESFEQAFYRAQNRFIGAYPQTLRLWLSSVDYDTKAVLEYSGARGIPIVYCDDPEELAKMDFQGQAARAKGPLIEMVEGFIKLYPEVARLDIAREYMRATYPVKDCAKLEQSYQKRDQYAAGILRAQEKDVAYVCGLDHIFGDYCPNLYDLLADKGARRMRLSETDRF